MRFRFLTSILIVLASGQALGEEPASRLSGAEFQEKLEEPVTIQWAELGLREAMSRLSEAYKTAIFLDRRLDPDRPVHLVVKDLALIDTLRQLADQHKFGVSRFSSVVYLGPEALTQRLATVAAMRQNEIQKLPGPWAAKLAGSKPLRWDELATPRDLIRSLATSVGLEVQDLDRQVPHDLWARGNFPKMPWSDRMSMLLAGFDLTFEIDTTKSQLKLLPIPGQVQIVRGFTYTKGNEKQLVARLAKEFPQLKIQLREGKIWATGRAEELEQVGRAIPGNGRPKVVKDKKPAVVEDKKPVVYDLRVSMTEAGELFRRIAAQTGLEVTIDPLVSREKLDTRITFDVKDVSLEKLLRTACEKADLRYELQDKTLRILP